MTECSAVVPGVSPYREHLDPTPRESMMIRCGLTPETAAEFQRLLVKRIGLRGSGRGSGRTTRMLCDVLVAVEAGHDVLVIGDKGHGLKKRLKKLSELADINVHRVSFFGHREDTRGHNGLRFVDHWAMMLIAQEHLGQMPEERAP